MCGEHPLVPLSQDLKYTLMAAKRLLRHAPSFSSIFGGADPLNRLLREAYAKNPTTVMRTHDFYIFLDPSDMGISPSIGVLGWYELKTTELFIKLIRRGSTVIDVGANVGFFTLLAARLAGSDGVVLSFEPEASSYSLLSKSIERNDYRNVQLFQQCVSNINGQQTLHLSVTSHKGLHSTAMNLGGEKVVVPSTKLDTVASGLSINSIDLLKIDAEGAEPEVLEGATCLLSQSRVKNIIMEWEHPEIWARHKGILDTIFNKYDCFRFARSFPFLPARRLTGDSDSLFETGVGTNVYLRLRR
jgi:FkbM family methyltransferase